MNKLHLRLIYKCLMFTLLFFMACGFQTSFWPNVMSFLPSPQIWLIILFFISIRWKSIYTLFFIYFLSYCVTLFSIVPLKMLWTPLALIYFALVLIRDRIRLTGVFSFILYCLVGSALFEISSYVLSDLLEPIPTQIEFLDRLLQVLINFIFSYPIFFVLELLEKTFAAEEDWRNSAYNNHDPNEPIS